MDTVKGMFKRIGFGYLCLGIMILKVYLTLMLLSFLISCTSVRYTLSDRETYIDKEFIPYTTYFEEISGKRVDYPVRMGDLTYPTIGRCINIPGIYVKVTIDRDFWIRSRYDYYLREEVLLHEFGHCSLYRLHDKSMIPGFHTYGPGSLMYPTTFGDTEHYRINRDLLIRWLIK